MSTTITFGSADFATALHGTVVIASPAETYSDDVSGSQGGPEFARFVALTDQLMAVGKGDLQERLTRRQERLERLADRSTSAGGLDRKALRRKK